MLHKKGSDGAGVLLATTIITQSKKVKMTQDRISVTVPVCLWDPISPQSSCSASNNHDQRSFAVPPFHSGWGGLILVNECHPIGTWARDQS